jgi:hypothetical protein
MDWRVCNGIIEVAMDLKSDDCRISTSSRATQRGDREFNHSDVAASLGEHQCELDATSCFTEAELTSLGILPVPTWARKTPRELEPTLFDGQED